MMNLLQLPQVDTVNVEAKLTEVIETVKNTPADVLISDLLDKMVSFGLKVLAAFALYFIGIWIIRKIKRILGRIFEKKHTDTAIASFVQSIASIALTIVLIIIIVGTLGIDTSSLAALLAGGGMAIGMALNGTVQNFAGGIMILIFRPFKAGDYIQAQGFEGTVSEVTITSTKLTTVDNRMIVIPNGALSNGTINNYSHHPLRRLDITVNVEYGTSTEHTKKVLNDIISADKRILDVSKGAPADPFIALSSLSDNGIQFVIRLWVNSSDYWGVNFDTLESIYSKLPENGIQFPFPKLDITVRQN